MPKIVYRPKFCSFEPKIGQLDRIMEKKKVLEKNVLFVKQIIIIMIIIVICYYYYYYSYYYYYHRAY